MFTRFNAALAKFCMVVAVIGLLVIVCCVLLQVFGRYVLNDTPTWAEALALVLVLWVTMLGAAVGVRDAGHICGTSSRSSSTFSPRCSAR